MSLSYQNSWKYLQGTYIHPKVYNTINLKQLKLQAFTDRCRDPGNERGMPTMGCSSVCISMMEPDIEAGNCFVLNCYNCYILGVLIGYKHIRGCLDRVLRNGFNQSALRTHRFHQNVSFSSKSCLISSYLKK